METLILEPKTKRDFKTIKTIAEALNIPIKESPYNPEFVAMVEQGRKDLKKGKGRTIKNVKDLWK